MWLVEKETYDAGGKQLRDTLLRSGTLCEADTCNKCCADDLRINRTSIL